MTELGGEVGLILELGRALNAYGIPTRRLESSLMRVALCKGMEIQVSATVTCLIVSFGRATQMRTALARLEPQELDLGKLTRIDRFVEDYLSGHLSSVQLHQALVDLRADSSRPHHLISVAARAVGAGSWGFLLGGRGREAAAAAIAASLVAVLDALTHRYGRLNHEFAAVAAVLSGACVIGCASWFGPVSAEIANLAALLPLLPGLGLVIATEELASKDLIAGTSRLVHGGLCNE